MTENAMVLAGVETVMVGSGATGKNQVKVSGKVAVNQKRMRFNPLILMEG